MPRFIVERDIPEAGKLSAQELKAIAQQSNAVLRDLGPPIAAGGSAISWVHSYVTDDRIYCVYLAPNPQVIREHARIGGFPADRVSEVRAVIDPTTGD